MNIRPATIGNRLLTFDRHKVLTTIMTSPDTMIEDPRWEALPLDAVVQKVALQVSQHLAVDGSFCVMGCDDDRIADLNADFRGKPSPTNVLSWPSEERGAEKDGAAPVAPNDSEWGDIAISYDTCWREAQDQSKPFVDHVTHLVAHGMLHLLGYDHERPGDAALMEGLEVEILSKMGLANPYTPN